MQVRRYRAWNARSAYYLARTLAHQLESGHDYHQLKPAIGIHLLDFDLFTQPEHQRQALWCFEMRDRRQPTLQLGDELQLNLIELPKADRLAAGAPALAAWVTFLEHWQEKQRMQQIDYPPVQQALERLRGLSADAEIQRLAFVRERALRDERNELFGAREEGREEGRIQGEVTILERLLRRRFGPVSEATRTRLQTATPDQLEAWAERLLDAPNSDAVFLEQ